MSDLPFDTAKQLDLCEALGLEQVPEQASLAARFGVPPFSVLNAREGWWQERKAAWLALGIESELGRGGMAGDKLTMSSTIQKLKPSADQALKRSNLARCYGQDLMRGEHVVGRREASFAACRPHKGHDPRPGRQAGEYTGGDAWMASGEHTGTSIFDPVLTELAYRWFCPPGGLVLDPFAGGSVRGIVASRLGYRYVGIELREEQLEANRDQAARICSDPVPEWRLGDARDETVYKYALADFVFTCPPYGDLEIYSDDPRDLSTMPWPRFKEEHAKVVSLAVRFLRADRFACWVVGDFRCPRGFYRGFPETVVGQFAAHLAWKYNEAILVTAVGSLPVRVGKQFEASRKLGKTHQNVLVFAKGDPEIAAKRIGAR